MAYTSRPPEVRSVAFVFPGQGNLDSTPYSELYHQIPVFRRSFDNSEALFRELGCVSFRDAYWNGGGALDLADPRIAHPFIFSVQLALAETLEAEGVVAEIMIGHSLGEFAALAHANRLPRDRAVRIVADRSVGLAAAPSGRMLMLSGLSQDEAAELLGSGVYLAAENGPGQYVFSGDERKILELERRALAEAHLTGVRTLVLPVPVAAHSPILLRHLDGLRAAGRGAEIGNGRTVISTLRAEPFEASWDFPDYLVRQATETVRFTDALAYASGLGANLFIEIGHSFSTKFLLQGGVFAISALGKEGGSGLERLRATLNAVLAKETAGLDTTNLV